MGGLLTPSERSLVKSLISRSRAFSLLLSLGNRCQLRSYDRSYVEYTIVPFRESLLLDVNPLLFEEGHSEIKGITKYKGVRPSGSVVATVVQSRSRVEKESGAMHRGNLSL